MFGGEPVGDCGHNLPEEQPASSIEQMLGFLN